MVTRKALKAGVLVISVALWGCSGVEGSDDPESASPLAQEQSALTSPPESGTDGVRAPGTTPAPSSGQLGVKHQAFLDYVARRASMGAAAAAAVPSLETVQQYATKCEDATGIRIPAFSCENGYEVPQGTVILSLTDEVIGATWGQRTLTGEAANLEARGSDIWGTADQFYFSRVLTTPTPTVTGDGAIEVQVTKLTNTDQYAKAGVMFRASAAAGAANVMMAITPGRGAMFQRRLTANGTTVATELAGRTVPTWLRLVRSGNTFTGFVTSDRVTWTQVGPAVTIPNFPAAPLAGLALTSHNVNDIVLATFDRFRWAPKEMHLCDRPNVLNGRCDPGSRFQVLGQNGDAAAVVICRKEGVTSPGRYNDVALIQYNKVTGGLCFFQALPFTENGDPLGDGNGVDGTNVPAPIVSTTAPNFRWYSPAETRQVGCPKCHDSAAFIRSPYLVQTGLLPNMEDKFDNRTKVAWVGADFAGERSWEIDTDQHDSDTGAGNCNYCHRLSVNNHAMQHGTAARFSYLATSNGQAEKNEHSMTSPIWMRRGQTWYEEGAFLTAREFVDCAEGFWRLPDSFGQLSPGFLQGTTTGSGVQGCTFYATGIPWVAPQYVDERIGITNGTRSANGTVQTVTARGADIYGTSDQFLFSRAASTANGMATVKVNSIVNTHAFAKAGLMLRTNSTPGSGHVMTHITPTSGAQFQYRPSDGATVTASTPLTPRTAPVWLRLYRTGNNFASWVSNDNLTWNQIAPATSLPLLSSLLNVGLAVTSHNTATATTAVFDRFSWVAMEDALVDANIGVLNGTRTLSGNNRLIQVAGTDIYGTSDQFFFSFKQVSGNKEIVGKINSIGNTHAFAKAGLMIRSSINANARHVMIHVTPTSGVQFQYRATDGASVVANTPIAGIGAPVWLRLERTPTGEIIGKMSLDNQIWTQVGSTSAVIMPTDALYGVAVTSHNAAVATTASVSNVIAAFY